MLIRNLEPRFTILNGPHPKEAVGSPMPEMVLRPGLNEVTEEAWTAVKDGRGVKSFFDLGHLEIIETKSGRLDSLPSNPRNALALVKEITDAAVLKRLLGAEKREVVRTAIEAQIKELKLPNE